MRFVCQNDILLDGLVLQKCSWRRTRSGIRPVPSKYNKGTDSRVSKLLVLSGLVRSRGVVGAGRADVCLVSVVVVASGVVRSRNNVLSVQRLETFGSKCGGVNLKD